MLEEELRLKLPMPESGGNKPTLEELLAAKRDERPTEAFWIRFDKELDYKRRRLVQKQIVDESSFKTLIGRRFSRYATIGCTVGCGAMALFVSFNLSYFDQSPEGVASAPKQTIEAPRIVAANEDHSFETQGLREFSTLASTSQPRMVVANIREPAAVQEVRVTADTSREMESISVARNQIAEALAALSTISESARPSYTSRYFNPSTLNSMESAHLVSEGLGFDDEIALGKFADPLRASGFSSREILRPVVTNQSDSFEAIEDFLNNRGSGSQKSLDAMTLRF